MTETAPTPATVTSPAHGPRLADGVTPEFTALAEELVSHYPVSKRSASLPLLHLWQNTFGYIDDSGVDWIAAQLDLQPINVYELVTFYPWFRQAAPGKNIIRVCRTLSCALAGSEGLYAKFCEAIGLDLEEARHHHGPGLPTSADGTYSVEFVECLASCGTAPVCLVNEDLYENVTPADIPDILAQTATDPTPAS
jgi:NADH-quinone oxidoreductase subunit E